MRRPDAQPLRLAADSRRGPVAPARRVDELDRRIIEALQENGRESFRRIAARLGVSEATVRARYARLVSEGILQVVAVTNPLGLGFDQALVGLKTSGPPGDVADELARWQEVDYVVVTAGQFDLVVEIVASDRRELLELTNRMRSTRRRRLDRDVPLSRDVEAALRLGRSQRRRRRRMTTFETAHGAEELRRAARDHLWLHFTRMGGHEPPIIVRGDGCYLEDVDGNRYLDALAGLFSVNLGYGFGDEIGQAALDQMRELPFYTNWSYAHPRAIELAAEIASLAPGDLNRVFFVSGGSEAVESAWKLARQYYVARHEARLKAIAVTAPRAGEPETRHDAIVSEMRRPPARYKAIARHIAYHGTTMGALSINGIPALRNPFEPLVPEVRHVRNTNRYHRPADETEEEFTRFLLDDLEQTIVAMGPESVCMVHMEPVQNAGGAFVAPEGYWAGRAGDLRPLRHPALGRRGHHRLRPARALVRLRALRHPAGHHHVREGPVVVVRGDRRGRGDGPRDGAVPRTRRRCTRTGSRSEAIP